MTSFLWTGLHNFEDRPVALLKPKFIQQYFLQFIKATNAAEL